MTWPLRRMDEVVEFLNSRRIPIKASDRAKRTGPFPYYGASGIVDWVDDFIFDGEYLLVSEDGENLRSRKTPIAFLVRGKYWVNNHAHILDEKEPGILKYLSWALNRTDLSPYLTGAAQPKLNKRTLSEVEIPIPPKLTRTEFNKTLGALDDKIELNRKISQTLEEMARAIYRSWFVDFDPVHAKARGQAPAHMDAEIAALFPDRFGEDGLPEGWETKKLKDLMTLNYGKGLTKSSRIAGEYSVYGSGGSDSTHNEWIIEHPTVIVGRKGTVGSLYLEPNPCWPIDTVFYTTSDFSVFYIYQILNSLPLENMNTDAAVPGLNRNNVYRLDVTAPDKNVIDEFTETCCRLYEYMWALNEQNQTLADLRDTLLPKLMSGELCIKDAERKAEEVL